ncbi:hypothetical protein ES703_77907 [subsurface metagenome]
MASPDIATAAATLVALPTQILVLVKAEPTGETPVIVVQEISPVVSIPETVWVAEQPPSKKLLASASCKFVVFKVVKVKVPNVGSLVVVKA